MQLADFTLSNVGQFYSSTGVNVDHRPDAQASLQLADQVQTCKLSRFCLRLAILTTISRFHDLSLNSHDKLKMSPEMEDLLF